VLVIVLFTTSFSAAMCMSDSIFRKPSCEICFTFRKIPQAVHYSYAVLEKVWKHGAVILLALPGMVVVKEILWGKHVLLALH
jgi:hypothetical protein